MSARRALLLDQSVCGCRVAQAANSTTPVSVYLYCCLGSAPSGLVQGPAHQTAWHCLGLLRERHANPRRVQGPSLGLPAGSAQHMESGSVVALHHMHLCSGEPLTTQGPTSSEGAGAGAGPAPRMVRASARSAAADGCCLGAGAPAASWHRTQHISVQLCRGAAFESLELSALRSGSCP